MNPKTKQAYRAAAAVAAEAKRKEDLAADLARKDVVELELFAKSNGVDISGLSEREEMIAAIELKLEADAQAAASAQALADMEADEADAIAGEDDGRDDAAKIVRRLNADFCRDIPQEARSGSFEPGECGAFSGEYAVKDGRYRVVGSDWLFDIKKKRIAAAMLANADNKFGGKGVIQIA